MTTLKPDDFIHAAPEQASPGVARYDVKPVNSKAARPDRLSYVGRIAIHPKEAHGTFRSLKWAVMIVTLGIYYVLPWVRWDRRRTPSEIGTSILTRPFFNAPRADEKNGTPA